MNLDYNTMTAIQIFFRRKDAFLITEKYVGDNFPFRA